MPVDVNRDLDAPVPELFLDVGRGQEKNQSGFPMAGTNTAAAMLAVTSVCFGIN